MIVMSAFDPNRTFDAISSPLSQPAAETPISLPARGPGGRGLRKQGEESPGSTEQRCRVTPGRCS